jgi:hypothetical protein
MKIYVLREQEEIVTEDPDLTQRWQNILDLIAQNEPVNELVQEFDALIIEKFGANSRFLGSQSE